MLFNRLHKAVGVTAALLSSLSSVYGQRAEPSSEGFWDWCGTQRVYEQKLRARFGQTASSAACDQNGACDNPAERDLWIPGVSEDTQYVRMAIHVLARDDGSNPFSTPEHVAGQVAELNRNFAPVGIQFVYQLHQINSSAWRSLSESEIQDMKMATAVEPDKYLNVWVTVVEFSYSFGTFPWSYDALQPTGGIVMGHFHWVDLPNRVFAHEVGHTLGLWHTFHGVDEVTPCGECHEVPGSNSSDVGDLCADTPPTPTNQGPCVNYPGVDSCSDLPWGYTMPENYMGYASQTCLTTFTSQQQARLRCWSNTVLDSWSIPFRVQPSVTLGAAPLTVAFTTTTHKDATNWSWLFGDGSSAGEQSPSHTYLVPGPRTVTVDMTTTEKAYQQVFDNLILAYADTLEVLDGQADGDRGTILISVHNYLPLRQIQIPFCFDGPLELSFDSASTYGLRSSHMQATKVSSSSSLDCATILIDGDYGEYLEPGTGPVVQLYFTQEHPSEYGLDTVTVGPYSNNQLRFSTYAGDYLPEVRDGIIESSCCRGVVGDVNSDGDAEPTIGDISFLVTVLFIYDFTLDCYREADANQSGGLNPTRADLSIGDVSVLVDHLFISGAPLRECF